MAGAETIGTLLTEGAAAEVKREAVKSEISLEIADRAALEPLTGTAIDMLEGAGVIKGLVELGTPYGAGENVGNPGTELALLLVRGLITLVDNEEPANVPGRVGAGEAVPGIWGMVVVPLNTK